MASSIAFPTDVGTAKVRRALGQIWRWLAIAGAALVLAVAAFAVTRSHWLHVRSIEVTGASHLSRGEIVRLSGITKHDNAVWLDEGNAEARLASDPWVATADVEVDLPWTVTIAVTERSPIAVLERGAFDVLVASDGTLLGPVSERRLPVIVAAPTWVDRAPAPPVAGIARALADLPLDVREMVRRIDTGSPGGLEFFLSDGLHISYGSPRAFAEKAAAIVDVLGWAETTGEEIRFLDVSAPSAPALIPVT